MLKILNKQKILSKIKGFTLIELLVVISIIGLLSTVVLASVQKVRTDAKWRKFESELIEIRTAIQLYSEKNNGAWPAGMLSGVNIENVLSDLKSAGVYPSDSISYPDPSVSAEIGPSFKIENTAEWSCGSENFNDVYGIILFFNSGRSVIPETKFKEAYQDGVPYSTNNFGQTFYCIEIK